MNKLIYVISPEKVHVEVKICSKCKKERFINEFHNKGNGFIRNDCKYCVIEYGKKYREKHKDRIKLKKRKYQKEKPQIKYNWYLQKQYGISLKEYEEIFKLQDNSCAICKSKKVKNKQHKYLHLDHCHKTGKIRGILCSRCNVGLGHFNDDIKLLYEVIRYLEKNKS